VDIFLEATAQDVMTRNVICVDPAMSVRHLSEIFLQNNISGAPVVEDDCVVGFVSQTDIVELDLHLHSDNSIESRMEETGGFVQDIMVPMERFARETEALSAILEAMCQNRIHRLIVLDASDKVCGILTTMDVMCFFNRLYHAMASE
jgi:CIC family chloride channel protein